MDASKTYLDPNRLLLIAQESGLLREDKASWVKLYTPTSGPNGPSMYVPIAKRAARVDLSRFEMAEGTEGIKRLGGESFGQVHQQIEFSGRTEEQVLATFKLVADHMLSLPKQEKKPRKFGAPRGKETGEGTVKRDEEAASSPEEQAQKRLAHLLNVKKVADEKGIPVSKKILAEIASLQ